MYVNNIEPEMFLPPGSESFNHNATRTTSSRSRSNNVNNNIVPVYRNPIILQVTLQISDNPTGERSRNSLNFSYTILRHLVLFIFQL